LAEDTTCLIFSKLSIHVFPDLAAIVCRILIEWQSTLPLSSSSSLSFSANNAVMVTSRLTFHHGHHPQIRLFSGTEISQLSTMTASISQLCDMNYSHNQARNTKMPSCSNFSTIRYRV
jgi:hypothetical protein